MLGALVRRWPLAAALTGALMLAALGFAAGRWATPPHVETRTMEQVRWRERLVEVEKKVAARVAAEQRTRVVYRDRVVAPDGTVRERELEDLNERSGHLIKAELGREYSAESEHQAVAERREDRARPAWRVGVIAGAALQAPAALSVGPPLERRLVGPLSAGAWALVPTAPGRTDCRGLALTVEF